MMSNLSGNFGFNFYNQDIVNFQNEIGTIQSVSMVKRTIKSLDLYVDYFQKSSFKYEDIYKESPFEIVLDYYNTQPTGIPIDIELIDKNKCLVSYEEQKNVPVYDYIQGKFSKGAKVLVVVEGGNNGGDGLALARILHSNGYDVEIFWGEILSKTSEAFKAQLEIVRKLNVKFADDIMNCGYDIVVDAVFGAGLNRAITGKLADVINAMNDVDAFKLAVDIPSGIDATNGYVLGTAFRADATVTFAIMKMGLLTGMGYEYSGQLTVADIGVPKKAIDYIEPDLYTYDSNDVDRLLPYRKLDSHKGSFGKIGIIGGSKNMAGAAMFAAEASYRMGCGLVRICTVEENLTSAAAQESMGRVRVRELKERLDSESARVILENAISMINRA